MTDTKTRPRKQSKPTPAQRKAQSQRDKAKNKPKQPKQGEKKQYTAPVAKSKLVRTQRPSMKTLPNGDAIITHTEYVTDIVAGANNPSTFTTQSFAINPGQATTFQWLSRVANNYESYQFTSLDFYYETEAPTTLGGSLILTVDYDAADAAPTTKQQAMAYRSSVRSAPWNSCEHCSLKEDLTKNKSNFVRIGGQPPNTDIKTYDIGNLFVASAGVTTGGSTLGELYVKYTVRLMTPVYENYSSLLGGSATGNGTVTAANPFGLTPVLSATSNGFSINNASLITFTTPGSYLLEFNLVGTVITGDALTATNATAVVTALQAAVINGGGTALCNSYAVRVLQPGASVTYAPIATTITGCVAFIGAAPIASL
jgi:hypothetical protein